MKVESVKGPGMAPSAGLAGPGAAAVAGTEFGADEQIKALLRLFSHPGTTLPPHQQVKPMVGHLRTLHGAHVAAQSLQAKQAKAMAMAGAGAAAANAAAAAAAASEPTSMDVA